MMDIVDFSYLPTKKTRKRSLKKQIIVCGPQQIAYHKKETEYVKIFAKFNHPGRLD